MKKIIPIFALLILIGLPFTSCASKPAAENNVSTVDVPDDSDVYFPYAMLNCEEGLEFKSYTTGKRVLDYDPLPANEVFEDPVVIKCTQEFFYKGNDCISEFEMIYAGIKSNNSALNIERGDVLGTTTRNNVAFVVRTKFLDPYFVVASDILPAEYDGYFYFYPGIIDGTKMKWLNFYPADYEGFRWMYNHTVDPESEEADEDWAPGASYFEWSVYLEATLNEYPEYVSGNKAIFGVPIESEQVIDWKGMPLHLNYAAQFRDYLINEYNLGDKIVLYLNIGSISAFDKEFNCYVRDFAFETPEEMVERRLEIIKNR